MPLMGRWADGVAVTPGNVSGFATEKDGQAAGFIVGILVDGS